MVLFRSHRLTITVPRDWRRLFTKIFRIQDILLKAIKGECSAGRPTTIYQHLHYNRNVFYSHWCWWQKKSADHLPVRCGSWNTGVLLLHWKDHRRNSCLDLEPCVIFQHKTHLHNSFLSPLGTQHSLVPVHKLAVKIWRDFVFFFFSSKRLTVYEKVFSVYFTFSFFSCFSHSGLHRK